MTLTYVRKDDYFISAKKSMTFWSLSDEISIRLIPKTEAQTLVDFSAQKKWGWIDFGHEGRMVRNIFDRIKRASEGTLPHKEP